MKSDEKVSNRVLYGSDNKPAGGAVALYSSVDVWLGLDIPYETLVVPINYVNLCFSFLLSGLSLTVILWGKKVFAQMAEAFYL